MVPVVQTRVNERNISVENAALYPLGVQFLGEAPRQIVDLTEIVVDETDVDSRLYFSASIACSLVKPLT
ncbi:MAG: hypothetical protein IKO92_01955, partial [Clostridia bacterium]|nr:hypothetical protein [Clostridia bacterium]